MYKITFHFFCKKNKEIEIKNQFKTKLNKNLYRQLQKIKYRHLNFQKCIEDFQKLNPHVALFT
jgi:hypothetical protein